MYETARWFLRALALLLGVLLGSSTDPAHRDSVIIVATIGVLAGWTTAALAVLGFRRRPRLSAGMFAEETDAGLYEGYEVEAVVGRRPLEVTELGLLVLYGPRTRRRRLHLRGAPTPRLPAYLSDGQRVSVSFELGGLIDELWERIGDKERLRSKVRSYVCASGREYRGHVRRGALKDRLRQRARRLRRVATRR